MQSSSSVPHSAPWSKGLQSTKLRTAIVYLLHDFFCLAEVCTSVPADLSPKTNMTLGTVPLRACLACGAG